MHFRGYSLIHNNIISLRQLVYMQFTLMVHSIELLVCNVFYIVYDDKHYQGLIYYEANEASASGPRHLGDPYQNFNAVSKVDIFIG